MIWRNPNTEMPPAWVNIGILLKDCNEIHLGYWNDITGKWHSVEGSRDVEVSDDVVKWCRVGKI